MRQILHPSQNVFPTAISVVLAFLVAMSPLAIDTYLSAMPIMAEDLSVGLGKIELTLTIYFLGFAFGNFIGGPLSDSFGRKRIASAGIVLYAMSAFLITMSNTIEVIWLLRFFQAFGGGFSSVTAMVIVRDWFQGKQVARLATLISMIMMFAPLLAPVLGAVLLATWNWKAIFMFLCLYAIFMFAVLFFFMPESREKTAITRTINAQQFWGRYALFFKHRQAVLVLFSISISVSGMFAFITGASFIYLDYFQMPVSIFPVLFGANVALNVALSLANTFLLRLFDTERLLKNGLMLQLLAGGLVLVGAWLGKEAFWVVFSAVVLYVGSLGMIFGNGNAIILNLVPELSGSANAAIGVTRFILSSLAGSIPALFAKSSLIPVALVMLACSLLGNLFYQMFLSRKTVSIS